MGRGVWLGEPGNRQKATAHTPFGLASLTKPFTATVIMTLVAEGKLSLDQPANKYLGASKLTGTNGRVEVATVRRLGAHCSGLPGMYESFEMAQARLRPTPTQLLAAYGRLAYPPGTWYEYSNIGYAALHAMASELTHQDFGALLQERVLGPLGLEDSFFGSDAARVTSGATRYDPLGHPIPHYITSTPASGEMYASAHDLANFLLFNMAKGQQRKSILSSQELDEVHRSVFQGASGIASTFGWFSGHTASGVPYFLKTGGDPGVANRMCFIPSRNLGCVVVTNQSNAAELAYSVCDDLIAAAHLPDWRQPQEDCGFPSTPFVATPSFLGRWRGTLTDGGADSSVQLNVMSNKEASLAIGAGAAAPITALHAEGIAMAGLSTGHILSPDALRAGATALQIKLLPQHGRLVGRIFAVAGDPSYRNVTLPYVLTLSRERT